jgi:HEPN domain-containing protein
MATEHLHDDPKRTTPRGLVRYAAEFMEAALAADAKMGERKGYELSAPIPVLFLIGQAIELALKAFLLSKDIPLKTLRSRDYGHQLHVCLRKAKEMGLRDLVPLKDEEEESIKILDPLYSTKQLQYIVSGFKTFPIHGPLECGALRLIHGIGNSLGMPARNLPGAP